MSERNLFYEQLERESDGDYVEVVRCRDCKNLIKSDDNFGEDEPYYYCDIFNHMINFDDFCSRAERKE